MKLPDPQLGLVLRFEYQWLYENVKGMTSGVKDRPAVVVLIVGDKETYVAPITSTTPQDFSAAVKIPEKVQNI